MILYHGGTLEISEPRILRAEVGRDFGFAFYTTDIKAQAERWATRKARIENRRADRRCQPIVSVYTWDTAAALDVKRFEEASLEWLELVVRCRGDLTFRHDHDIVVGKIANDNVGETVSYVMQGIMRKEDAVARLKFEQINNQIAFCTEAALKTLSFVESYTLEG
ncbi:hypothetical protein SDC9_110618 [bioreactor metagenome]|uniref:DUF3990 domain-containing protein n=1 Tax=bioreactor metagenome TaxID=1076179 RepID=A0A645BF49_9ZZZZ